jgi:diguanylate cyclase
MDQLISPSIVPYIMCCFIIGVVLLLRPLAVFFAYLSSYAALFIVLGIASQSASALIANRMDSLIAMGVAVFISVIMWRNNIRSGKQQQRIQNQQSELEIANKELEEMAYLDPLTGISNRRYFDDIVNKEIAHMKRKGHESCLIMLDLDFFKNTNDMYGHPAGDSMLIEIARLLASNIRKSDSLCRLGGEEFIILLPETELKNAVLVAENLRKKIESTAFQASNNEVHITASFGVAKLTYGDEATFINQYTRADHALYIAKDSGRNCVKTV